MEELGQLESNPVHAALNVSTMRPRDHRASGSAGQGTAPTVIDDLPGSYS